MTRVLTNKRRGSDVPLPAEIKIKRKPLAAIDHDLTQEPSTELTPAQKKKRATYERHIWDYLTDIEDKWFAVGKAWCEMRDQRLFLPYVSIHAYAIATFKIHGRPISKPSVTHYMEGARIRQVLETAGFTAPMPEAQTRALIPLMEEPERLVTLVKDLTATGETLTADMLRAAVRPHEVRTITKPLPRRARADEPARKADGYAYSSVVYFKGPADAADALVKNISPIERHESVGAYEYLIGVDAPVEFLRVVQTWLGRHTVPYVEITLKANG